MFKGELKAKINYFFFLEAKGMNINVLSLVHLRRHFERGEGPGDEVVSLKNLICIVEVIEKCLRIGGLRKHTTLVACHATPTSKGAAVGLSPLIETKEF